jgi:hypothetical protein
MENMTTSNNSTNEYSFRWGKQFSFLTLRTLNTKLIINNTNLIIHMDKYFLGFIKGKSYELNVPINSIHCLSTKKMLTLTDLVIAGVYAICGFFIHPLFFLAVPLSIWACMNINIILNTKTDKKIKIPSFSTKETKEFINFFNDIYIEA